MKRRWSSDFGAALAHCGQMLYDSDDTNNEDGPEG